MSAIMKRSAGVTVTAIVSLLGSALAVCFGILTGVLPFVMSQTASEPPPTGLLVIAGAVYFLPGVWGLLSGIGLIRLKNWARISTIVFGALLILFGGFTAVMAAIMATMGLGLPSSDQIEPATAARVMIFMRGFMGVLALGEIGIGVWWVVFLTRPKVAAQFGGAGTAAFETGSGRPISISIIAWLMLIGIVGAIFALVMHSPVPLFTTTLSGLPAAVYMIAMIVAVAYCGVGLLRLQPAARLGAIAYFVFGLVNTTVFAVAPGGHARMAALIERQQAMMPMFRLGDPAAPMFFDPVNMIYWSMLVGSILTFVPLYFLVARKRAFESSAK
jgi:hypothetical protein